MTVAGRTAATVVLGMGLALTTLPGHAQNWTQVSEGIQYDARSLRVNGNLRQVWMQIDFSAPDRTAASINRFRGLFEFDCTVSRFRMLSMESHSGKGVLVDKGSDIRTEWTSITRAHEAEAAVRARVCAVRN